MDCASLEVIWKHSFTRQEHKLWASSTWNNKFTQNVYVVLWAESLPISTSKFYNLEQSNFWSYSFFFFLPHPCFPTVLAKGQYWCTNCPYTQTITFTPCVSCSAQLLDILNHLLCYLWRNKFSFLSELPWLLELK